MDAMFEMAYNALSDSVYCYDNGQGDILDIERFEDLGLDCEFGASRMAIIMDDYVLKKAYDGFCEDKYDDEGMPYVDCWLNEETQNSCELEAELYAIAVEEGVGQFFAKTEYIGNCIFKQERADELVAWTTNDYVPPEEIEAKAEECGLDDLLARSSVYVVRYLMEEYTVEELKKLQDFLNRYDIDDLHAHNAGWVKGKLKFIDYVGTNDTTSEMVEARKEI